MEEETESRNISTPLAYFKARINRHQPTPIRRSDDGTKSPEF